MVNRVVTLPRPLCRAEAKLRLRTGKIAVFALASLSLAPGQVHAATINAAVKAKVLKPLVLQSVQNLDLGTIMLGQGSWSGAVVRLTRTGAFTCPAQVSCTGARQTAVYNLSGSNNETIVIRAPNVTMVNQSDGTKTLTLVPDAPATIVLANSGSPGTDFPVGGSITLNSTTADGVYVGTFQVTADYQ